MLESMAILEETTDLQVQRLDEVSLQNTQNYDKM